MGVETAIAIGLGVGGGMLASKAFGGGVDAPKIESGGEKSIQAGISDSENRRQSVMQKMATMRKQTLLAKRDQPAPTVKPTTLGPG